MTAGALALFEGPRKPGRPRKLNLSTQLTESLRAAEHLRGEDLAMVELGRRLAHAIDATDDDRTLASLAAQLITVLDKLGMNPRARRLNSLDVTIEEVNPLADLALIRRTRRGAEGQPRT